MYGQDANSILPDRQWGKEPWTKKISKIRQVLLELRRNLGYDLNPFWVGRNPTTTTTTTTTTRRRRRRTTTFVLLGVCFRLTTSRLNKRWTLMTWFERFAWWNELRNNCLYFITPLKMQKWTRESRFSKMNHYFRENLRIPGIWMQTVTVFLPYGFRK